MIKYICVYPSQIYFTKNMDCECKSFVLATCRHNHPFSEYGYDEKTHEKCDLCSLIKIKERVKTCTHRECCLSICDECNFGSIRECDGCHESKCRTHMSWSCVSCGVRHCRTCRVNNPVIVCYKCGNGMCESCGENAKFNICERC